MVRIGDIIERKYRIESVLGRGGMGTVYAGTHTKIHRRVAIKILKGQFSDDAMMVERFEREALAASAVQSDHVVEIFDVGQLESGEHYMIMEFLEGESLSKLFRRHGWMAPEDLFPMAVQLLRGLAAAHEGGIVHRDLKPGNIFITSEQVVKIVDFGVSKFASLASEGGFTQTGAIVGTPHYMAPEQTKAAKDVDNRADLYAVGAILFRGLTGRTPFEATTIHEIIAKLIASEAPKLASVVDDADPGVARIIDTALAKAPAARYRNASEMIADIEKWLDKPDHERTQMIPMPVPPAVDSLATTRRNPHPGGAAADDGVGETLLTPTVTHTPDPSSMHTPAPSIKGLAEVTTYDAQQPGRPRVGLIVGVTVVLTAAIAGVATFVADTSNDTLPTPAALTEPEPEPASESEPEPELAPATSATASTATPKIKPAPRPRAVPRPGAKPTPKAPPPAPKKVPEREFREDI